MGSTRLVALAFLVVAAFVVTACSSASPTASFSASSVSGEAPLVTRFTDSSEGEPTSWTWDFGDGSISTEQHPSHRYTAAGTYSVTLAATNDSGSRSVTLTDLVMVQAGPAVALTVEPASGPIGQGNTHRFIAVVVDAFGNRVNATVIWTASRGGTIDALGVFTAGLTADFFPGAIVATVDGGNGLLAAEADVEVALGRVSLVQISGLGANQDIGNEIQLSIQAFDASGNEMATDGIGWAVAGDLNAISASGLLTVGTQAGDFEVTATVSSQDSGPAGGAGGSVAFSAAPGPLARLSVEQGTVRVSAGASQQLIATPMDAYGNVLSGATVSWRSTSAGASVTSAGRLTAATLVGAYGPSAEAIAVHIGVSAQATVNVIVVPAELTQVVLGPTAVELGRGLTQQFVVAAGDRFGNRIADAAFEWSVTDGGSIDDSGLYTAGDVPGEYDVKVSVGTGDDATTAIAKVTVLPERISFFSDREDDSLEIYIMDLDGSNVRRLTEAPTVKFLYSWSADDRRLAYDQLASARASC